MRNTSLRMEQNCSDVIFKTPVIPIAFTSELFTAVSRDDTAISTEEATVSSKGCYWTANITI